MTSVVPAITDERPHKAEPRYLRLPEPIDREIAARAQAAGMSWSDVVAGLLAFALGGYTLTKKGTPH